MSANLSAVPKLQFFDNNGNPLVAGKLYTYEAGTTTPLATYTDASATTPNTNPVILDSRGEANVWLTASSYKFVLKDASDVTIWTVDNVSNAINTSQILASSGSAAAPPYTFASDTDTGIYLAAVGQIGITVAGTPVIRASDTAMTFGQSGGSNDVDVTHYGDTTQTGNIGLTGNYTQTGDMTVSGAAVFNEAGADKDFRVEGDVDANLLFVDASTNRVGVGMYEPDTKLHVFSIISSTPVDPVLKIASGAISASTGIGAALQFEVCTQNFAANPEIGVVLSAETKDITAGSEDFDFVISTMTNGAAASEKVRVRYDGNVGIGDTNPAWILSLSRTTSCIASITNGVTDTRFGSTSSNDSVFGSTSSHSVSILANNVRVATFTPSGLTQFNSGYGSVATAYGCRAWLVYDGVTNAITNDGNIDSVTDLGTGTYQVFFTNAMPDALYSVVATAGGANTAGDEVVAFVPSAGLATGSFELRVSTGAGAAADVAYVSAIVTR